MPTGERVSGRWADVTSSFGFLAGVAVVAAVAIGFALPALDNWLDVDLPVFAFDSQDPARDLLGTIATVTVAVAGVAFSVTIVAFTLASSQLSPRVLRSFRGDTLSRVTLALFLATAIYCLVLLVRLGALEGGNVPNLSITLAILLALVSFVVFAVFIGHIVEMLQPASLIAEIEGSARRLMDERYPHGVGQDPDDERAAWRAADERMRLNGPRQARASDEGYVGLIRANEAVKTAEEGDALIRQVAQAGDYVVPGDVLAEIWCSDDEADELVADVVAMFELSKKRGGTQDVGFPIRQLADVALKGLSPGINDPTTAENAMNALAATLIRYASAPGVSSVRVDETGHPRYLASVPDLNDLVRLGFEQVRVFAAPYPVFALRLIELLEAIGREAAGPGIDHAETGRQVELLGEGPEGEVPTSADAGRVARAAGRARRPV